MKVEMTVSASNLLELLKAFRGYGNPSARIWFLGMEEGAPKDEKRLDREVEKRMNFRPIMGLDEAHELLDRRLGSIETRLSSTWIWMARFARAIIDQSDDWIDLEKAKRYVIEELGQLEKKTFVTDLLPLPAHNNSIFPYKTLFIRRKDYEEKVIPERIKMLQDMIAEYKPRYVFAYGKKYREHYRFLANASEWKIVKDAGSKDPIEFSGGRDTTFLLLPFFGRQWMNDAIALKVINSVRSRKR